MKRAVRIDNEAMDELAELRAFDYARTMDVIRGLQVNSDHGKVLTAEVEAWGKPVRQVRVGNYRVFFSIDSDDVVRVHAVRLKGTRTTGEIIE